MSESHPRQHIVGSRQQKSRRVPSLHDIKRSMQHSAARSTTQYTPPTSSVPATPAPSSRSLSRSNVIEISAATPALEVGNEASQKEMSAPASQSTRRQRKTTALLFRKYTPRKVLENRGSTARDHLASERTFLAYVRTSIALASAGVAVVQMFTIVNFTAQTSNTPLGEASRRAQMFARPLGVMSVLLALSMLGIAVYRFFLVQNALPDNMFPVARVSVVFTTFVLSALVVVMFAALLGR